jgi:AcrR family transcriptional regulator
MRQAIKSATMRARIIDATIRCLVKYGYAKTTTLNVAAEAKVSRGAMMHHFNNAAALIYATAEELHQRRLKAHVRRAKEIDHKQTSKIVHQSWNQFASPIFVAFLELAMAARTNEDLAAILSPLQREYSQRWYTKALELYPEWDHASEEFDLAFSLAQVTMQGMALALATESLDQRMVEPLLKNLDQQIKALRAVEAHRVDAPPARSARKPKPTAATGSRARRSAATVEK